MIFLLNLFEFQGGKIKVSSRNCRNKIKNSKNLSLKTLKKFLLGY